MSPMKRVGRLRTIALVIEHYRGKHRAWAPYVACPWCVEVYRSARRGGLDID